MALKGLLARRLRLALTVFAVALGVTLVAGTYVFTDTINRSFDRIFEASYAGIDVAVVPREILDTDLERPPAIPHAVLDRVRAQDGVAHAEGSVFTEGTVLDGEGERIGGGAAPNFIASTASHPGFDASKVVDGRSPVTASEATLDRATARRHGFALGDSIDVQGEAPRRTYRIVGITQIAGVDSFGGATVVQLTLPEAQRVAGMRGAYSELHIDAAPGASAAQVAERVRPLAGARFTARTGEQEAARQAREMRDNLGFLRTALLAFAGISLFVGAFGIFNTFSITVAQRSREFALLRTLGATRRQVLRSVLAEGLVLGAVGSAIGLALGLVTAAGLRALLRAVAVDLPSQGAVIATRTIVVSLLLGIVVTLVAALAPALRATRVAPVEALRDAAVPPARQRLSRRVTAAAIALTAAGVALLCVGLFASGLEEGPALSFVGGGAAAVFLGVALGSPRLVRPLAAVVGAPVQRLGGMTGRLARENSIRQPGRTAVTAAALMVGVALVTFASIFAAGARETVAQAVDTGSRADGVVQHTSGWESFTHQATRAVAAVPGVEAVAAVRWARARVGGDDRDVSGVDAATFGELYQADWVEGSSGTWRRLDERSIVVSEDYAAEHDVGTGDRISMLTSAGRRLSLSVIGVVDDRGNLTSDLVVSNALLERAWGAQRDSLVLVAYRDDAAKQRIDALLRRSFPEAEALTNEEFKDDQAGQVNQALGLIYALLSLAILVSLFGIVNTLTLSIHERTRELGLLRAIGTSRRQVRRMMRLEAVIVALIGSVLGLVLGVVLAVLVTQPLDDFTLAIPYGTLAAVIVLGGLAGVLASIAPGRRASQLRVLDALAYE